MTAAQPIQKAHRDLRGDVDIDDLIEWADESINDIFNLDIPLFEKRKTDWTTTDGTLKYTISSSIGTDVRKIKDVFYQLNEASTLYDEDYHAQFEYSYKHFNFTENGTDIWLEADPDGKTLTAIYYRTPTAITALNTVIDLPTRWASRVIYRGIMRRATERQYKTPSGDWESMWGTVEEEILQTNRVLNRGPRTVQPYSIF